MDDPWSSSPWGASSTDPPTTSTPATDDLPTWSTSSSTPKAQAHDDGWGSGGWNDSGDGGWGESVDAGMAEKREVVKPVVLDEEEEEEEEEKGDASPKEVELDDDEEGDGVSTPTLEEEEISLESPPSRSPSPSGVVAEAEEEEESYLPSVEHDDLEDDGFASIPTTSFSPPPFSTNEDDDDELPSFADEPSFSSAPPRSSFPSSPSFDADGFGGFSTPQIVMDGNGDEDDPWGGDGGDVELDASGGGGWAASGGDDEEEEEWGGETRAGEGAGAGAEVVVSGKVDEWEEASRLAAKRQARAPQFVLNDLSRQWQGLSTSLFPDPEQPSSTPLVEGEVPPPTATTVTTNELDRHLSKTLLELTEPSLTSLLLPSTQLLASSQQPFKLTTTSRRFQDALTRTTHLSSSSILSTTRRRPIGLSSPEPSREEGNGSDWWGIERSMLGEPEREVVKEEPVEQKKSFWARKKSAPSISSIASVAGTRVGSGSSSTIPTVSGSPTISSPSAPLTVSSPIGTSSPATSVHSARPSLERSGSNPPSRPTTPRLSSDATPPPPPAATTDAPVAPSAVSRFLGRWSRKPAARATSVMNADGTPKELELSGGDFDFLEEVQGVSTKPGGGGGGGGGDLMGDDEGGLDGFEGLDGFLGMGTKGKEMYQTPLPKKLEPPPSSASRPPSVASPPPPPPPAAFSELDFLDFGGSSSSIPPVPQSLAKPASSPSNGASFDIWDDFMASPPPPTSTSRSATPILLTAIPGLSSPISPPASAPLPQVRSSTGLSFGAAPTQPLLPPSIRPSSASPLSPTLSNPSRTPSFSFPPPPKSTTPKPLISPLPLPPPPPPPVASSSTSMFDDDDDDDDDDGFGDFGSAPPPSGTTNSSSFNFPSSSNHTNSSFSVFNTPPPPPRSSSSTFSQSNFFSPPPPPAPPPPPPPSQSPLPLPLHLQTSNLQNPNPPTPTTSPSHSHPSQPPTPPTKSPRHASSNFNSSSSSSSYNRQPLPPPVPKLSLFPSKRGGGGGGGGGGLESLVQTGLEQQGKRWPAGPVSPGIPTIQGPPGSGKGAKGGSGSGSGWRGMDFMGGGTNGDGVLGGGEISIAGGVGGGGKKIKAEEVVVKEGGGGAGAGAGAGGLSSADLSFFDSL